MQGIVNELIERARKSKVFKRNKKSLEVKILSVLFIFLWTFFEEDEFVCFVF